MLIGRSLSWKYDSSPDPITSITGYLKTDYSGGTWNGTGIDSTYAGTTPGYGLGSADGLVAGLIFGPIEIKNAMLGDAKLDGAVNGIDFALLASNFKNADQVGNSGWDKGISMMAVYSSPATSQSLL